MIELLSFYLFYSPVSVIPGEGILERNLGVDIVVVVTKTDYMSTLEKDFYYKEEHFDFVQQYIRKFCLKFGAGLFYTSAKEDKNCDLLYKYLAHRLYGFPFRTSALIVEKDAVLIPSGEFGVCCSRKGFSCSCKVDVWRERP